jgi:hypothetical protein
MDVIAANGEGQEVESIVDSADPGLVLVQGEPSVVQSFA